MATTPLAACACGSTTFDVCERLWHPAAIQAGQLVIIEPDDSMDDFQFVICVACGHEYALDAFDTARMLENYQR